MTLHSLAYILFLSLTYLCFCLTGSQMRWLVLLLASYGFYACLKAPHLLLALWLVTALSYFCGLRLDQGRTDGERRLIFWCGTFGCLATMVLVRSLPGYLAWSGMDKALPSLLTTIGVSYFCFQSIAYLADIYLGVARAETHPGYHALALAFFPKLLQGPIERSGGLLPQLRQEYRFDYQLMRSGIVLFVWGMFKKLVIADRLAIFVNAVYGNIPGSSGLSCLLATYFFAIQLYCDFSGYTDMALGSARIFGIRLSPNFNRPYLATSVADFWRRWHISFSRWILDYIFMPLQMHWRYRGVYGTMAALLVTFLASGIWHGAHWGFVVWGGLHGCYLAASVWLKPLRKHLPAVFGEGDGFVGRWLHRFVTAQLVCFAWIFFRAKSLTDAGDVIRKIGGISLGDAGGNLFRSLRRAVGGLGMTQADMMILLLALTVAALVALIRLNDNMFEKLFSFRLPLRWSLYLALTLFVILLRTMSDVPYLYFRF